MAYHPVILIVLACVGSYAQQSACPINPCLNGATCFLGEDLSSYYCNCPDAYTGTDCEIYNVCFGEQTCYNGGTCHLNITHSLGYNCECPAQFWGDRCETLRVDDCALYQPCQNGGTCVSSFETGTGYECHCAALFEGNNCQTMINDVCSSSPCMNGGTCFRSYSKDTPTYLSYICVCRPDYAGMRCEEAPNVQIDSCEALQPCRNGGTCFVSSEDDRRYICVCPTHFSGDQCEVSSVPDMCLTNNPCQHNSTCVHLSGALTVTCQCGLGYVGEYCERIDDGSGPCLPNPCGNGGTCNPDPFKAIGYSCKCESAFSGVDCELEYLGCFSNPCNNGGTCIVHAFGAYYCQCPEGYVGRLCQDAGPCASLPCLNSGICTENAHVRDPVVRAYNCICQPGFMGTHCEQLQSDNPCVPNPCNDGMCFANSEVGMLFICSCPEDTVGDLCNDDPCKSTPCMNGGTCAPIFNPLTRELVAVGCICPTGYTGPTCAVVGPCQSNPCQNGGVCKDSTGSSPDPLMDWGSPIQPAMLAFFCICPEKWTGTTCSESSDPCDTNSCLNNGTCVRTGESSYTCLCEDLYAGPKCESRVVQCSQNPCLNSGTCRVTGTSYTCDCASPYIGFHCERYDPCASMPCLNNGVCFRSWMDEYVICQCSAGFTGNMCEESINFCTSRPCQNGGSCYTGTSRFVCICTENYSGELCTDYVPTTTTEVPVIVNDACQPNPCLNGGTCLPIRSDQFPYTCYCLLHYAGLTCGVRLERMCDSNVCLNGGTCVLQTNVGMSDEENVCVCVSEFAGNTCALLVERPTLTTAISSVPTASSPPTTVIQPMMPAAESTVLPTPEKGPSTMKVVIERTSTEAETSNKPERTMPYVPEICFHDTSVYDEGQVRVTDCVRCTCSNGEWVCAERNCDCMIDGISYKNTDTWNIDCNTCICNRGIEICTEISCANACFHDGTYFLNGDSIPNECNICTCDKGNWSCSDNTCADECVFGEKNFFEGQMRKESCNSCYCLKEAQWLCTVRDCEGAPIIISVSFKINHDFAAIQNIQQEFIQVFKEELRNGYNLAKQNIQNVMVFPGSIKVMFDLVEVKISNVNVEAVAFDLQHKVQSGNYSLPFHGLDLFANRESFSQEKLQTGQTKKDKKGLFTDLDHGTSILIAVVACGILGLLVVIGSVCYFTRHTPRRARTEYGEAGLPRVSVNDNTDDGGFVNIAYQDGISEAHSVNQDNNLS